MIGLILKLNLPTEATFKSHSGSHYSPVINSIWLPLKFPGQPCLQRNTVIVGEEHQS